MKIEIQQEVLIVRKEIELLLRDLRCVRCGKIIAQQAMDGSLIIQCRGCKSKTVIKS